MLLRIDRSKWVRGDLHSERGQCALGWYMDAAGVNWETHGDGERCDWATRLRGLPEHAWLQESESIKLEHPGCWHSDHTLPAAIMCVNDTHRGSDFEREQKLIDLFGKVGVDVEFYGEMQAEPEPPAMKWIQASWTIMSDGWNNVVDNAPKPWTAWTGSEHR
jgi:hypothetical protein